MPGIEQPRLAWMVSLLLGATLIVGGCGGGGDSSSPAEALVLGKVVSVDGQTSDLAGVDVGTADGSTQATTDATGAFRLSVRAGERVRLRFEDGVSSSEEGGDVEESGDDTPDGTDIDGDEVEIEPLEDGETCEIEVELENGEVVEAWVNRERDGSPHFEAEARLVPPEDAANQDAIGEVEIECGADCCRAEIEVAGLTGPDVVEIVLWHPEGDEVSLGIIEVNAEGAGRWEAEVCWETGEGRDDPEGGSGEAGDAPSAEKGDGDVPFGEETLGDLKGVRLLLIDGLGNVVLVGEMPGSGAQHDDEDHCHALTELEPPEGSEVEAEGVALLKHIEGCEVLVIEVGGFDTTPILHVWVEGPEGNEALLGEFEVSDKGMGRFAYEACPGDELPFGVESLTALGGYGLFLATDAGVLLQGEMPVLHDGDCDDEKDDDDEEEAWRAADGSLEAPETSPEPDAEGWILAKQRTGACVIVIEVGGIAELEALTVVVVPPEGEAAVLGSFEIGLEGDGRYAQDGCDELPFEAASLDELAGYGVELRDGEGNVVLAGEIPTLPAAED